jgi:mannose-1-phosphate guanylyltransferase
MGKHDPLWMIVLAVETGSDAVSDELHDSQSAGEGAATPLDTQLGATLARASRIAPKQRIIVSISRHARKRAEKRLASHAAENIITQPFDRGTAAGALLPFFHIFRRDPMAKVLVLPTNQFVEHESVFTRGLLEAAAATPDRDNRAVVLGMTPGGDEHDRVWIVPSERGVASTREIVGFSVNPPVELRAHLIEQGALINSSVFAANTSALLRLYDNALPGLLRSFLVNLRGQSLWSTELLAKLYRFIPKKDLVRDLLLPSAEICRVLPVPACGWIDLGKPDAGGDRCLAEGTGYLRSSDSRWESIPAG